MPTSSMLDRRSFSGVSNSSIRKPTQLSESSFAHRVHQITSFADGQGPRPGKQDPCDVRVELLSKTEIDLFQVFYRGPLPDQIGAGFWVAYSVMRVFEQAITVLPMALYLILFDVLLLREAAGLGRQLLV